MTLVFAAIGPYLEIIDPVAVEASPAADVAEAYHALWGNEDRLKWVHGKSDPLVEEVNGILVIRMLGVPTGGHAPQLLGAPPAPVPGRHRGSLFLGPSGDPPAPGASRHTLFQLAQDGSGAYAVTDVGTVDRAAEVTWFEREYAREIGIARRAWAGTPIQVAVRWGMVCWRS
jgi:hypothetical protein